MEPLKLRQAASARTLASDVPRGILQPAPMMYRGPGKTQLHFYDQGKQVADELRIMIVSYLSIEIVWIWRFNALVLERTNLNMRILWP